MIRIIREIAKMFTTPIVIPEENKNETEEVVLPCLNKGQSILLKYMAASKGDLSKRKSQEFVLNKIQNELKDALTLDELNKLDEINSFAPEFCW
jgi:hypothetical protein